MKRLLLLAAAVALLLPARIFSVASAGPVQARPIVVPFELANRHIIVKATINGSKPLPLVLDTGADQMLLTMDRAKQLGLALRGSVRVGGAGPGSQQGALVSNATWSLVGVESLKQPVTMALPLTQLADALGVDADGIIGGEFIREFVLEVDYQAKTLTFHDPASFTYSGRGETLPLDFTPDRHPVLRATVTPAGSAPTEESFLLDLGGGGALVLHSPFVNKHELLKRQPATIRAIGGAGAGGKTAGQMGRVADFQIGSAHLSNVLTMFSEDSAGAFANPRLAGNIGAQIANRFRMFLDYKRKRIILEHSVIFDHPYDRAFSGLAIRGEGPDHRSFRIIDVLEKSAATDVDLKVDDVVTAIDGRPASELTLTTILEMFEKPVTYEVTVRRGSKPVVVKLTPRRMV